MKRDVSEPLGERLIKEDIESLKKQMRKLDFQKHKLNNAFEREIIKVEEYKSLREQEKQRKFDREMEKRFKERRDFEEKMKKKAKCQDKTQEVSTHRVVKKKIESEKKSLEREEIENYV